MKRISKLFLLMLLLSTFSAEAQLLANLENGVPLKQPSGPWVGKGRSNDGVYTDATGVYVVHHVTKIGVNTSLIALTTWDGTKWHIIASFTAWFKTDTAASRTSPLALNYFQGDFYIFGSFDSIAGVNNSSGVFRWNGSNLLSAGGGLKVRRFEHIERENARIIRTKVYKGKLYVAGPIDSAGLVPVNYITCWDGNAWSYVGSSMQQQGLRFNAYPTTPLFPVTDMEVYDDKLYVSGCFDSAGSVATNYIAVWDNSNWSSAGISISGSTCGKDTVCDMAIDPVDSSLYFTTFRNASGKIKSGIYTQLSPPDNGSLCYSPYRSNFGYGWNYLFPAGSKMWKLGTLTFHTSGYYQPLPKFYYYDNTSGSWIHSPTDPMAIATPQLHIVEWQNKPVLISNEPIQVGPITCTAFSIEFNKSWISGRVYFDKNNNCVWESQGSQSEKTIPNVFIRIPSSGDTLLTDEYGWYTALVPNGSCSLYCLPGMYTNQTCPSIGSPLVKTVNSAYYTEVNIGVGEKLFPRNLSVELIPLRGARARRGVNESYRIVVRNNGTQTVNGLKINVLLSSKMKSYNPLNTPYQSFSDNLVQYNLNSTIYPYQQMVINFNAAVHENTSLQDTFRLVAYFPTPYIIGDSIAHNNADTVNVLVSAALDPNEKYCKQDSIINPSVKKLDYQINFQNVGTDYALNVYVIDTIDSNLPLSEITFNSTSHYLYKILVSNNALIWYFLNINLPDSGSNEPNSHGWIRYTAKLKHDLPLGTVIKNKAHIYFDYEKPVITNTAIVRIQLDSLPSDTTDTTDTTTSVKYRIFEDKRLRVYPIPANEYVSLESDDEDTHQVEMYNQVGVLVYSTLLESKTKKIVFTQSFPSGIYYIRLGKTGHTEKVVVSH